MSPLSGESQGIGFEVAEALLFRLHVEEDPWVEEELEAALRDKEISAALGS